MRKAGMHPAGRNNPCGAKKQDKVADNSSLAYSYIKKRNENLAYYFERLCQ